jgi:hypothetical protein
MLGIKAPLWAARCGCESSQPHQSGWSSEAAPGEHIYHTIRKELKVLCFWLSFRKTDVFYTCSLDLIVKEFLKKFSIVIHSQVKLLLFIYYNS